MSLFPKKKVEKVPEDRFQTTLPPTSLVPKSAPEPQKFNLETEFQNEILLQGHFGEVPAKLTPKPEEEKKEDQPNTLDQKHDNFDIEYAQIMSIYINEKLE